MKKSLLTIVFFLSVNLLSAQNIKATTEDGKKVILKEDKTWIYDDNSKQDNNSCIIDKNFKEPVGEKKDQAMLKRVDATVADFKKHVSVDTGTPINKIILMDLSEQLGNAIYIVCVDGVKMKYRRTGSAFFKDKEDYMPK